MSGTPLPEDQAATREAALDRQIAEQTRLLVQLKSKRSLWQSESAAGAGGTVPGPSGEPEADASGNDTNGAKGDARIGPTGAAVEGRETGSADDASLEKSGPKGSTEPLDDLKSTA